MSFKFGGLFWGISRVAIASQISTQMIHKHGVFLLSTRFEVHVNTVLR